MFVPLLMLSFLDVLWLSSSLLVLPYSLLSKATPYLPLCNNSLWILPFKQLAYLLFMP